MLKWKATADDGTQVIGIGLERENVVRLQRGMPITVNAQEMGFNFKLVIHYGETAEAMVKELKGAPAFYTEEAKVFTHTDDMSQLKVVAQDRALHGELSYGDLCALSRRFNQTADLNNAQHQRINEWLKDQIAGQAARRQ